MNVTFNLPAIQFTTVGNITVKVGQTLSSSAETSPDTGIRKKLKKTSIIYLVWESLMQWQSWYFLGPNLLLV